MSYAILTNQHEKATFLLKEGASIDEKIIINSKADPIATVEEMTPCSQQSYPMIIQNMQQKHMSISKEHINDIPHKIAKAQSPLLMAMCNYIKSQSSEEQKQSRELISLLLDKTLARINNPEDIHIQDGITLRIMEVMLAAYLAP